MCVFHVADNSAYAARSPYLFGRWTSVFLKVFYRGRASVMPASCPRAPRVVCAELKPKRKSSSA